MQVVVSPRFFLGFFIEPRRREEREGRELRGENDAFDAIFEDGNVEIDEKA